MGKKLTILILFYSLASIASIYKSFFHDPSHWNMLTSSDPHVQCQLHGVTIAILPFGASCFPVFETISDLGNGELNSSQRTAVINAINGAIPIINVIEPHNPDCFNQVTPPIPPGGFN